MEPHPWLKPLVPARRRRDRRASPGSASRPTTTSAACGSGWRSAPPPMRPGISFCRATIASAVGARRPARRQRVLIAELADLERADEVEVGDQAAPVPPFVQQHARRLHDPARRLARERELHGVRDAGRDLRDGAGEAALHAAVDVAAQHALAPADAGRSPRRARRRPPASSRPCDRCRCANGGWCRATRAGVCGASRRRASSQASCSAPSWPAGSPGTRLSSADQAQRPERRPRSRAAPAPGTARGARTPRASARDRRDCRAADRAARRGARARRSMPPRPPRRRRWSDRR